TAEGVETVAQLQQVRALGCTEMQGFLFSPRRLEEIEKLFRATQRPDEELARKSAWGGIRGKHQRKMLPRRPRATQRSAPELRNRAIAPYGPVASVINRLRPTALKAGRDLLDKPT